MKKIILVIDDEKALLDAIEELLTLSDYTVHKAYNGKQGLKLARKVKPNAILLDILMPDMNGYEVLEALKQDEETAAIPVIMLSSLTDDMSKIKSAQLYSESYLTKPVAFDKLKAKIEEVIKLGPPR